MCALLLAVIYLAFVSLGLPDSLLGSAWPVIYTELNVPVSYAGILTMIIAGGTIVSSLLSDRMTRRVGAGPMTAVSVLMTAVALFGFSSSNSFVALCLWALPYGLGAGGVDAALNNYVALHYSSRHMSWLHCFWGVGAAVSPYIMGWCLTGGAGWRSGYGWVSLLQIVLSALLFLSLPLWKKRSGEQNDPGRAAPAKNMREIFRIPGVKYVLLAFFGYCAAESTAGLWASSYLVLNKGVDADTAARFASLFFLGITVGRFVSGLVADKVGDRNLIRIGLGVTIAGIVILWLPVATSAAALGGLIVIGLGCAPIYPCIIHATPSNFGAENSQAVIGVQMASAYTGTTFMPLLFGVIADHVSIALYPLYLLLFVLLMLAMTELLNRVPRRTAKA